MELINIEKNMREAVLKIEEIGGKYAEARGISYQMQELKKVVLAREMGNYDGSVASRETLALASEGYSIHINGTKDAIIAEARLKAEYTRWQAQYESCRSLLSLEKAKVNLR